MTDYKLFEETATGRFYKVYKDGVEVSQHYTEREAIESAQEVKFQHWGSEVKYVHEYEVNVGLTDAGITEAQDYGTPVDTPPTITETPSPSFTFNGVEQTYDMTQHVSDDGVSAVTYGLTNVLPNGLDFSAATGILTYDGIEGASVSQHQLTATDAVGTATSNTFDITIAEAVGDTALELLANGTSVGQWQELVTTGLSAAIDENGEDGNILTYGNSGNVWNHTNRKIYWIGGDHNGGDNRFITYDADTNSWSTEPFNAAFASGNIQGHGYFRNSLDQSGNRFWWSQNLYDIDSNTWTQQPLWNDPANQDQARFPSDWFPDLGLVFFHDGRLDILRNGTTAGGYDRLATGLGNTDGNNNHTVACYSPKANHMIFGGGDGGGGTGADAAKIWRLDSDETITQLTDLPFEVSSISGSGGQLTTDPVTGKFLYLRESNQTLYEFDATLDDGWNVHSTTSHLTATVNRTVLFPIQSYGVLLQIEYISPGVSKMWVYKHHEAKTLAEIEADPDTLSWFDYETALHHPESEAYFVGTYGMANQPLTDTNDPVRYVRDNANSAAYLQGTNAVANTGSDFQVNGGGGWNTSYYQELVAGDLAPAMYPRHEDGVGEFENLTGTVGRTAMKIITRQGYSVGGDVVYALQRSPAPPSTTAPFSFLTAGEGAEIWLRFAIKHNDDWLATPQTPTAPKRSIYQGRDSTSDLEETLQNVQPHTGGTGENFLMYTNENSGGHIHPSFSPPLVESRDWTIIHIRHVTGTEGVDDAITELYVNEETTPRFTDLTIDTSDGEGPLISGLQFIDTSSTNTNQGYWKFRLTTFHTSRDGTQASNDLVVWYDNLIIRKNTRCPALRPTAGAVEALPTPTVPDQADWVEQGEVILKGTGDPNPATGSSDPWDKYIQWYSTSMVYLNGTYFFYYMGGCDAGGGDDPNWRSLGVATATNPLGPWTTYPDPIRAVFPNGVIDEGHSSFVTFVEDDVVYMYFNQFRGDPNDVESDIWVMQSTDGITFTGDTLVATGPVLKGDEAWPTGIIRNGDLTYLYYGGSGPPRRVWMLTLSGGAGSSTIDTNHGTIYTPPVSSYANWVQSLDGENYAMFIMPDSGTTSTVHTLTKSDPTNISGVVKQYTAAAQQNEAIMFDPASNQWLRFYARLDYSTYTYGVHLMTAPRTQ